MRIRAAISASVIACTVLLGPFCGLSAAAAVAPQVAPACLVLAGGGEQCFSSVSELQVAIGQEASRHGPRATPEGALSCSVILFSGAGYSGQALGLTTPYEWINLVNYGFADAAVSFLSSGCGFHLAQGVNGGGYWYPGYTGPGASCPNMGAGWNDTVQSVYIE